MKKVYFYNKEKERLVGIIHNPKKKTNKGIIFVHGFKGNKEQEMILNLAKRLSSRYNVLRFDFSGNGESGGEFKDQSYSKYIEELKNAIKFFKNEKICLIGHSLGGNIIVLEEKRYNNADLKILIAPALKPKNNYNLIKKIIVPIMKSGELLKRRFFIERFIYNPIKNLKKEENIILAEKDKAINLEKSINLCRRWGIKYKIIKNAKHNFYDKESYNQLENEILKLLRNF